jgi:hypothetical protein
MPHTRSIAPAISATPLPFAHESVNCAALTVCARHADQGCCIEGGFSHGSSGSGSPSGILTSATRPPITAEWSTPRSSRWRAYACNSSAESTARSIGA